MRLFVCGLCLAFLAIYARTWHAGFVWDDPIWVVNNPRLTEPLLAGLSTTQHAHMGAAATDAVHPAYESYRPLAFASVWLDHHFFGANPAPMHVENLLWGLLYAPLVLWVARALLVREVAAATATAMFLLHPMQVEVFAYICTRGDILAGLCALAAVGLVVQRKPRASIARLVCVCLLFLLSLLAKESAIGLPFALAALGVACRRLRLWFPGLLAMLAAIGFYLVLRVQLVGAGNTSVSKAEALTALINLPGIALAYAQSFVWPFDLSIARPVHTEYTAAGWALTLISALFLLWRNLRKRLDNQPIDDQPSFAAWAAAGWLWLVCLVGPSAVVAITQKAAGDRYAHLGVLGLCLLGGTGAVWAFDSTTKASPSWLQRPIVRRLAQAVVGAFAITLLVVTFIQVSFWRNNVALYQRALQLEPQSAFANYQVGYLYAQARRWPEAATHFATAVKYDPENSRAHNNLGVAYLNSNNLPSAQAAFRASLATSGNANHRAWANLGTALLKQGNRQGGCEALQQALHIVPSYSTAVAAHAKHCRTGTP
ncbi:MAG: tetratricopeptide repeat protein [Deltaproteobacteria bacterium]|nr:tetratricopeptide repeat protein [Deltaproteobacteria bacterium]